MMSSKLLRGECAKISAFLISVSIADFAVSAPWDFGVNLDLGVVYTDNILLKPSGEEESDIVYTIVPELYLQTDGDRIEANLRYRPEAYFYGDNSDFDNVFHVVDARLTTQVIRDRVFVQAGASQYQSIVTSQGQFPTTNVPISNNRVDSRILELRPYWDQRVGSADMLLEASYSDVRYDDESFQKSEISRGRFDLNNFERQQGIAWGVNYEYTRTNYEFSQPWEFQRAAGNLGYWFTRSLRLFAVGGAESDIDRISVANLDEDFWEAGLQYKPNKRMDLEFAVGERAYGASFRMSFDYQLRRGTTNFTYTEAPISGAQLPTGTRPIVDSDNLDRIQDEPGRSDRFLQRRLQWYTSFELARSQFSARLFGERREGRTTDDGSQLSDEELAGLALRWVWDIGSRTTLGMSGDVSRRNDSIRKDDLRRFQVDLSYRFSERLSVIASIMNSQQRGIESSQFDYDENQLNLRLRSEF